VLLHPDRLCATLAARLAFAFRRGFVLPAMALAAALQVLVWTHAAALAHDATHQRSWLVAVPVLVVVGWLITMLHELAHGVTCRHFGGVVTEIGLSWRFPLLTPYCRTDDIVLFHRRTARVGTAFAGVFVGLLSLGPVALWWWLTRAGGAGHSIAAALLLFGSAGSLMSLLPFLRSDGYVMLTHALDLVDLRRESYRFWRLRLRRGDPAARERLRGYRSGDARAYALYGVATLLVAVPAYGALMWVWYGSLRGWIGPGWAVAVLAAETAVLAGLLASAARGRGAKRQAADV
jgi:putative peptide zinc metalloprotease protein